MRPLNRLLRQTALLSVVGSGLVSQLLAVVTGILTARMLGVTGRGDIALIAALAAMTSQFTLGGSLPAAVNKTLAAHNLTARDGLGPYLRRWAVIGVGAAALSAGVYLAIKGLPAQSAQVAMAGALVVIALQNMIYAVGVSALFGERAPIPRIALAALAPQTCLAIALSVGYLITQDWSTLAVLLVMIASSTIGLAVLMTGFAPSKSGAPVPRDDLRRAVRHGYVANIGPIDRLALDRILVGVVLGVTALGLYATAVALSAVPAMIGYGIATIVLPKVAAHQHELTGERAMVRRWVALSAVLLGGIVAILTVLSEPIITIAFGDDFAPAVEIAHWLLPAAGFFALRRVLIAVAQGRSLEAHASLIELVMLPVLLIGIAIAAAQDDVVTVAQSMLGCSILACTLLGSLIHFRKGAPGQTAASERRKDLS